MTGMNYPIVPLVCERARRDEGLPARLDCNICARGPCGRKAPQPDPDLHRQLLPQYERELPAERTPRYGWAIPNRLYGAEINQQGEAI